MSIENNVHYRNLAAASGSTLSTPDAETAAIVAIYDGFSMTSEERTQANSAITFTATTTPATLSSLTPFVASVLRPKPRLTIEIEDAELGEITQSEPFLQPLLDKPDLKGYLVDGGWIHQLNESLYANRIRPADEGKNGAFFAYDPYLYVCAVIKPQEHELGAPKCAIRKAEAHCGKRGIKPGEGARPEYLASEVIRRCFKTNLYAPETIFAKVVSSAFVPSGFDVDNTKHVTRYCSIQEFIPGCRRFDECSLEELSDFKIFPIGKVQTLALFDIMMFNTDRHPGNLLVQPPESPGGFPRFVPIDNGYILPRSAKSPGVFCWQSLPQLLEPVQEFIKKSVGKMGPMGFYGVKEFESLDRERKLTHVLAVQFLKQGIDQGLNLYEIANFCTQAEECDQSIARSIMLEFQKDPANSTLDRGVASAIEKYKELLAKQEPGSLEKYEEILAKQKAGLLSKEEEAFLIKAYDSAIKELRSYYMTKSDRAAV